MNRVNIEQLHLRVSGLTRQQGAQLGQQIAQGLATHWPRKTSDIHLGALSVRITTDTVGADTEAIANQVVRQIIARVRVGGAHETL